MIIGSHVSFKNGLLGCVKETMLYNANTFMFYTGAPQNSIRKPLDIDNINEAKDLMNKNNIDIDNVICHAPYIINLATFKDEQREFGINFFKEEINRCKQMGVKKIVFHPGNAVGIPRSEGLLNVITSLKELVSDDFYLLIETMAGKGTELCTDIDELKYVINQVNHPNLSVCLDTCHLNDSGVDIANIDEYLDSFDKNIGLDKIKCVHVNDSKNVLSSKKDRHENIGFGTIGFDSLLSVVYNGKLKNVPKILETPYYEKDGKSLPPYKLEIDMIKSKVFNEDLLK